jgi:hypothetical protein
MKKQMSLFIWAVAVFGMAPVFAATNSGVYSASSADLSGAPSVRSNATVNYEKYETRSSTKTYAVKDGKNIYYSAPAKRGELYKQYSSASARTNRAETTRTESKRKYYLAHPFYQPLQGVFGSVTDLSYNFGGFDFDIGLNPGATLSDTSAKWNSGQFTVKEDLSFGITDKFAVLLMAQYDSSKYDVDWKNSPDDSISDSGLNMYGAGVQWRFVDNSEWIATLSGYYERQRDIANSFLLDLKGGYKVNRTTVYGLVRGWYVDFDGTSYGSGIETDTASMFIAYKTNDNAAFYVEGGLGVFSVLDEDWTLNLEAILGNYDWHNQGSIKAAIGWQPGNNFALNLYAKTSFYDSANNKSLDFYWKEPAAATPILDYTLVGNAKLSGYSETSIGLQAIVQF